MKYIIIKLLYRSALLLLLLFASKHVFAQSLSREDSANLSRDLRELLKKYKLENSKYLLSITLNNQEGGQTAFLINNYTVNNNYNAEREFKREDGERLVLILDSMKRIGMEITCVDITLTTTSNGIKFAEGLSVFLKAKGYNVHGIGSIMLFSLQYGCLYF